MQVQVAESELGVPNKSTERSHLETGSSGHMVLCGERRTNGKNGTPCLWADDCLWEDEVCTSDIYSITLRQATSRSGDYL